jgi:predicted transcriptional regulator
MTLITESVEVDTKPEEERKTVGAHAVELMKKVDEKINPIDMQREMLKGYFDELVKCAKRHEDIFGKTEPYYICVQTRAERLMVNVKRNMFYARKTRPRPEYDLALYYYDPKTEQLSFVWCIPDRETVDMLIENELVLPKDQRQLLDFCKAFKANTLV